MTVDQVRDAITQMGQQRCASLRSLLKISAFCQLVSQRDRDPCRLCRHDCLQCSGTLRSHGQKQNFSFCDGVQLCQIFRCRRQGGCRIVCPHRARFRRDERTFQMEARDLVGQPRPFHRPQDHRQISAVEVNGGGDHRWQKTGHAGSKDLFRCPEK